MRTPVRWSLVAGFVVAVLAGNVHAAPGDPPLYHGKTVAYWVHELNDSNTLIRDEALAVVTEIGPAAKDALPVVRELMQSEVPELRRRAAMALWKINGESQAVREMIRPELRSQFNLVRTHAFDVMIAVARDGGEAAAELVGVLDEPKAPHVQSEAQIALGRVGAAAVPALLDGLDRPNPRIAAACELLLGNLGKDAKAALPALRKRLVASDEDKALRTVRLMWRAGAALDEIMPTVQHGCTAKDDATRLAAYSLLISFKPRPKEAQALVEQGLADVHAPVRLECACELCRMGAVSKDVIPVIQELLKAPKIDHRRLLSALVRVGPAGKDLTTTLVDMLRMERAESYFVCNVLAGIGPASAEALAPLASDSNPYIRLWAVSALQRLGGGGAAVIAAELDDDDGDAIIVTMTTLGSMGPGAEVAVPKLAARLKDANVRVRLTAVRTLAEIGPGARSSATELVQLFKDPQTEKGTRHEILAALAAISPRDQQDARALAEELIKSDEALLRVRAAQLLWACDRTQAKTVVPLLLEAMDKAGNDTATYFYASTALRRMGPDAREAIEPLRKMLREKKGWNVFVADALGRMGAQARPAIPELIDLFASHQLSQVPTGASWTNGQYWPSMVRQSIEDIGFEPKTVAPRLLEVLKSCGDESSYSVLDLLGKCGKDSGLKPEDVRRIFNDFDDHVTHRLWAAEAVVRIDAEQAKVALPRLTEVMRYRDSSNLWMSAWAATIVLCIEPNNQEAGIIYRAALRDPAMRRAVVESMSRLGPAAGAHVADLLELLDDPDMTVRQRAAEALWRADPKTTVVLPVLAELLKVPNNQVRRDAAMLVGRMGDQAKTLLPALREARADYDEGVRNAVQYAIRRIDPELAVKLGL